MHKRNRPKQIVVQSMYILNISFSAVVQIGDVAGRVDPFEYSEAYGGYRGAPSFFTSETQRPLNTRLHYANQMDEDISDLNIYGETPETFRPHTTGRGAR